MQGFEGKEPRLAGVVTLASSLDYTSSKSTLKMLLPLVSQWISWWRTANKVLVTNIA